MSHKSLPNSFICDLFEHISDAVYLIDPETSNILWVNKAGYQSLHMEKHEVLNHSVLSLQKNVTGVEQWISIANAIRESENEFVFIGEHQRKDGSQFQVEVSTTVFIDKNTEYFISVARDISTRIAREAKNQSKDQQIWFALNECADGLWDWNPINNYVYFSPSLKRMLGYGPDEMPPVLNTWKSNVHKDDLPMVLQALEGHLSGKRSRYEATYRLKNRNGHYLWAHDLGIISERDESGKAIRVTGMVKDITDYKEQEAKLLKLATYDELTNLRNRRECDRIFNKLSKQASRNNLTLSLILFDLDHFKLVNDKWGHKAGDQVLQNISTIVNSNLRDSDYFFRWGGEEFIIISINTNLEAMKNLANKLRLLIQNTTTFYENNNINITSSFGVVNYPTVQLDQLFLAADSALYKAKSNGRNLVC